MRPKSRTIVIDSPGIPHLEVGPSQLSRLAELSPELKIVGGLTPATLREAEVIFLSRGKVDPAQAPNLRWVQTSSAGIGNVLNTPLVSSNIPVTTASGAYSVSVAEMALTLLLALTRRLPDCLHHQHHNHWKGGPDYIMGRSSRGRTAGIIGYGSIGRQIGRLLRALGMRVLACKHHPDIRQDPHFHFPGTGDPAGTIPDAWYGLSQLGLMLGQLDVLMVALPETKNTVGLLSRQLLETLPKHCLVVNVGRGSAIDEPTLIELLRTGRIAGAGLDVFAQEPLASNSPLWELPNVVISPHIASCTVDQGDLAAEVLIENMRRYLAGAPLFNLIDFSAGY